MYTTHFSPAWRQGVIACEGTEKVLLQYCYILAWESKLCLCSATRFSSSPHCFDKWTNFLGMCSRYTAKCYSFCTWMVSCRWLIFFGLMQQSEGSILSEAGKIQPTLFRSTRLTPFSFQLTLKVLWRRPCQFDMLMLFTEVPQADLIERKCVFFNSVSQQGSQLSSRLQSGGQSGDPRSCLLSEDKLGADRIQSHSTSLQALCGRSGNTTVAISTGGAEITSPQPMI